MSVDTSAVVRSHEENWQPILELAVEEVLEIMMGCRVKPAPKSEGKTNREFTAMIGLAGSLCGVLTVSCDAQTARQLAKCRWGTSSAPKIRSPMRSAKSATWWPATLRVARRR